MAGKAVIDFLCGWLSGDPTETGFTTPGSYTVVSTPSPPGGSIVLPSKSMVIPVTKVTKAQATPGSMPQGGADLAFRPKTNPATAYMVLLGPDDGVLGGGYLKWGTDKKLSIIMWDGTVLAGPTTNTYDAGAAAWSYLRFRWVARGVAGIHRVVVEIFNTSGTLVDTLTYAAQGASGIPVNQVDTITWGSAINTGATAGEMYVTGLVLWYGAQRPPIWPKWGEQFVNSGPGSDNSTGIVRGDSTDSSTLEFGYIDQVVTSPTPSTEYLKRETAGSFFGLQFYGHASGIVPSGTVLAVGCVVRNYRETANGYHWACMKLGTTVSYGLDVANDTAAAVWEWGTSWCSNRDSDGNAWTIANADAARPGHELFSTSSTSKRIGTITMYAIYGTDVPEVYLSASILGTSSMAAALTVIPGAAARRRLGQVV